MRRQIQRTGGLVQKQRAPVDLVYDPTVPSLYGGATTSCCTPLFNSQCLDGSIGLFHTGGESRLALEWFGMGRAKARRTETAYLQYMGAIKQGNGATNMPGVPSAICMPGETTSFGEPCVDTLDCFGLLKLCSDPMVDGGNSLPYCERAPRFLVNGEMITDDEMWHEANATEALLSDMAYNLLWGVKDATTNKMGHYGLWSLLQGYGDTRDYTIPCSEMTPHILDWGGNPPCAAQPQAGITFDGQALADQFTLNLYSTIRDYLRGMRRRMRRTSGISTTNWGYGDWAMLGPEEVFDCMIECATCFTECAGNMAWMSSERAAIKLQELRNAGEGFGGWDLDNYEVPFIPFDPTLITQVGAAAPSYTGSLKNSDGTYNIMFLFRGVGSQRVLQPEYNPMDDGTFDTRDNAAIQMYSVVDDICRKLCVRHEWRWTKRGLPFQLLIRNIECSTLISDQFLTDLTAAPATVCP